MEQIKSFNELRDGDLIISPIDKEVTEYKCFSEDEKYLCSKNSMFDLCQFNPYDFYRYTGNKRVGEKDEDFLKKDN